MKKPPQILIDAGMEMKVNTIKLRELLLPVVELDIENLLWHFDLPVWEKDGTDDWNLTPWEVIKNGAGAKSHRKRVKSVDTNYPIIVTKYNSRYVILDGIHRLTKTYLKNKKKIKAKIIPENYLTLKEFQS